MKYLKKIRVILALIVFILFLMLFLDVYELIEINKIEWITSFQVVPALLDLSTTLTMSALILTGIFFMTLLFGRIYCSTLCPLGIFQDVIIRLKKWIKPKTRYKYHTSSNWIHYGIMAVTLGFWLFGSLLLLSLLDPYSNFGRITGSIAKPVFVKLNNMFSHQLQNWDIYTLHTVEYKVVFKGLVYSLIFLGSITWLSLWRGRLFCNLICPVGGILSILSRFGIWKLKIAASACTSCGKCMHSCKAECISVKNKKIDFSRCISCYNCIESCEGGAIQYVRTTVKNQKSFPSSGNNETSLNRRTLISQSLGMGLLLTGIAQSHQHRHRHRHGQGKEEHQSAHPVTPPGSVSLQHFNEKCIACQLCVSRCPSNVLQPSLFEYGFFNMSQPRMNYMVNYCSFDCTICSEICPTGAILPISQEEKHTCQIGKVHFIKHDCVVHADHTACGSCSEHCPTQAVYMVPYKGDLTIPEVNPDICVGCGACEYACPVLPNKAIFVKANTVHQIAEKPKSEKLEYDTEADFPF